MEEAECTNKNLTMQTEPASRRVTIDVVNGHRQKFRQRQKKRSSIDLPQIPIEAWPIIKEALSYGTKTHALGAMSAAQVLASIAVDLRKLKNDPHEIDEIAARAERESKKIIAGFSKTYND